MNRPQRQQRKAEILALSEKIVIRRGVRRRNWRRAAVASAAMLLIACGVLSARFFTAAPRLDSPVAHSGTSGLTPPIKGATPEAPIERFPSWVVLSTPLRDDQIIRSQPVAEADIATDSDLLQGLSEENVPGIVRVKGRVFAAYELLPPPPAAPVPAGSGPIPPREDSHQTRVAAAL